MFGGTYSPEQEDLRPKTFVVIMIQPVEMHRTLPIALHAGGRSTTTEVWEMLIACRDGNLDQVRSLISRCPALSTC